MSDLKAYAEALVKLCADEAQHILMEFQIPIVEDGFILSDFMQYEQIRQKNSRTHQYKHAMQVAQNVKYLRNKNITHIQRTTHK